MLNDAKREDPLLVVENLAVRFRQARDTVHAVNGISFSLLRGERLAIVGESGSGKSVTAKALMRLEYPGAILVGSSIRINGEELTAMGERKLKRLRGSVVARVPQDPMTSLNPVQQVGEQISEAIRAHRSVPRAEARQRAVELLRAVQMPDPPRAFGKFPHEFSGGMQQRALIAMAIAAEPDLLIADEPTTALDVSVQAEILELLDRLVAERRMALMLITHDLAIVAGRCDRVLVMYNGRIVEEGMVDDIYGCSAHPYTEALLASVSRLDRQAVGALPAIPGAPPDASEAYEGCVYRFRDCPFRRFPDCDEAHPELRDIGPAHAAACHFADRVMAAKEERDG